jgi:hypothetical protein
VGPQRVPQDAASAPRAPCASGGCRGFRPAGCPCTPHSPRELLSLPRPEHPSPHAHRSAATATAQAGRRPRQLLQLLTPRTLRCSSAWPPCLAAPRCEAKHLPLPPLTSSIHAEERAGGIASRTASCNASHLAFLLLAVLFLVARSLRGSGRRGRGSIQRQRHARTCRLADATVLPRLTLRALSSPSVGLSLLLSSSSRRPEAGRASRASRLERACLLLRWRDLSSSSSAAASLRLREEEERWGLPSLALRSSFFSYEAEMAGDERRRTESKGSV